MKFVFVAVVLVWMFIGFLAGLWARNEEESGVRSGVAMALFAAIVPVLPLIANLCGLI